MKIILSLLVLVTSFSWLNAMIVSTLSANSIVNVRKGTIFTFQNQSQNNSSRVTKKREQPTDRKSPTGEPSKATSTAAIKVAVKQKTIGNKTPIIKKNNSNAIVDSKNSIKQSITDFGNRVDRNTDKSWLKGITSQLLVISALFSLMVPLLLFFLRRKFTKNESRVTPMRIPDEIKNYVDRQISYGTQNTYGEQAREIEGLHSRINQLEEDIKRQNEVIRSIKRVEEPPITRNTGVVENKENAEKLNEIFYLSNPNLDGSFNKDSALTNYREDASIFKFELESRTLASFEINNSKQSVNLAAKNPTNNIEPVCDAENAFTPNVTKIITIVKGSAELEKDRWIVKRKAKIRYE